MKIETRLRCGAGLLLAALASATPAQPAAESTMSASAMPSRAESESAIWAMEQAILTGRENGDLGPYLGAIGSNYLGWPPVLSAPLSGEGLKRDSVNEGALKGEVISMEKRGFNLSETTALAYFVTHRTRLGVGFADKDGNRDVDQRYENLHVWSWNGSAWKLVGGMARLVPDRK
jgi:hypothetical protein